MCHSPTVLAGDRYRLGRRRPLDGLRGLAVLGVVVGHSWDDVWGTGQAGVTLFFVLSGFLITRLLLEEREAKGALELKAFWLRRAKRLLPALVVLLVTIGAFMAVAGLNLVPVVLGVTYIANFAKLMDVNLGLLEHLWTLSTEEQFYVVWPLTLAALLVRPRRWAAQIALALLGLVICRWAVLVLTAAPALRIMIGPDVRVMDLLVGTVLAFWVGRIPQRLFAPAALTSLALTLVLPGPFYSPGTMLAVAITAGACVGWGATAEDGPGWRFMSCIPLTRLGRISYGVYLWNFPVSRLASPYLSSWGLLAASAVITVGLAALSWRYVEEPLLRRGSRTSDRAGAALFTDHRSARVP